MAARDCCNKWLQRQLVTTSVVVYSSGGCGNAAPAEIRASEQWPVSFSKIRDNNHFFKFGLESEAITIPRVVLNLERKYILPPFRIDRVLL
jgi:hypothetical protein